MEVRGDKKDFFLIYENLPKSSIKNVVDEIIQSLKNDSIIGEHVKHEQIPLYYKKRHNIQVLYRIALRNIGDWSILFKHLPKMKNLECYYWN